MWLGSAGIVGGTLIALCSIGFYAAHPALPTAEELAGVGLLVAFELGALGVAFAQLLPRIVPAGLEPAPKRSSTSRGIPWPPSPSTASASSTPSCSSG